MTLANSLITTERAPALVAGVRIYHTNGKDSTMAEQKNVPGIVTKAIFVEGEKKKPGDKIELPELEMNALVSDKRATLDLNWKPEPKGKKKSAGTEGE
jgi:hypothetical protein